jgi:hypothetical protein
MLATGQLKGTAPETRTVLCKMLLAVFLAGADAPDLEQTLTIA